MKNSSNLPAGAEYDSRAPWNTSDLCRYCDEDQLRDIAKDNANDPNDDYEVDELLEKIKSQTGLCRHCHEEEVADFRDDD
jgi:hypothetical protein